MRCRRENQLSFPLNQRPSSRDGNCCSCVATVISRSRRKARNGIAAPIWSRGWRIAAPAIRRATRWVPSAPPPLSPAAMSTTGRLMRSTPQSPPPVPWDADALYAYLREGLHPDHGTARGPMAEVVSNLSSVAGNDVRAIATYMADVFGAPSPDRKRQGEAALAQAKSARQRQADGDRARRSTPRLARAVMRAAGRRPMAASISASARRSAARSAQPRQHRAGRRPSGRGRAQPDHAGLCGEHERRADRGASEIICARASAPSRRGAIVEISSRKHGAPRLPILQTSAGARNAPADPSQRDKP